MPNLREDSGQAMILTLVCMTVLLGFVGLAADIGLMFRAKRNMQIAADSAAIAGAAELNYGDMVTAGQAASSQNGVTNGVNGAVVAINPGPLSGPFAGNPNYVEAIVTQTQPTFFANVFNVGSMDVSARAVATLVPAHGIYTLAPAGTGVAFNGMTVSVPTGVIVDNSASQPAAMTANSGIVTAQSIGAVGGYTNNGATVTPTPVTGIAPISDPLAYLTAPAFTMASCLPDPAPITTTTLTPGCYNGLTVAGNIAVTFSAGMYIVNGAFNITGTPTITGTGVTFYFPTMTSSFSDAGTETLDLTAPTQSPYSGLLFFEDTSDTNALTINAAGTSTLEGIIYAPSASVTITGAPATTLYESIDAASVTLNGNGTLQDYAAINNSTVLTAAGLVE
jgi:hypothetical protein